MELNPIDNLRQMLVTEVNRLDDLRESEMRRVNEKMQLTADYNMQLIVAEAKRIDAIRAVDVNAVSVANERATAQAAVLANQVAASAETLRTLVAATASTVANQLSQISSQINDRLAILEKAQYESKGSTGGMKDMWGYVFGIGAVVIGFGITIYFSLHK